MKHTFLFALVVLLATFGLAACSDDCHCYEVTERYKFKTYDIDHEDGDEHEMRYIYYKWATPQALRFIIGDRETELVRGNNYDISITKKKTDDAWQTCLSNDEIEILDGDTVPINF